MLKLNIIEAKNKTILKNLIEQYLNKNSIENQVEIHVKYKGDRELYVLLVK